MTKHVEDLTKFALGWTVIGVEKGAGSGNWWKLRLRKGGRTRTLNLCATDLGAWVERVQDNRGRHLHFDSMVERMTDHLCKMEDTYGVEAVNQVTYEAFDDSLTLSIGFRCPFTGKEFVSKLSAVKESSFAARLRTPEGRQQFADAVWKMEGIW